MKKKIVFLIRELGYGGAQRQLITLTKNLDRERFEVTVLSFYPGGPLEKDLRDGDVPYVCLEKRSRWDIVGFFGRLFQQLQRIQPDVLHSYLSESNLAAIFLKLFFPKTRLIWGIRDSNISPREYDWLERLIFKLQCFLSQFVDLTIVNSQAGCQFHIQQGFPAHKTIVIPNGIDVHRFQPDPDAGLALRSQWGIPNHQILIGLIGRLAPMKDHPTFLKAAALLCQERSDVHFVCIGTGPEDYAAELKRLTQKLGLEKQITWTGGRSDMPVVYSALDMVCSASAYGEGFANVVGEAMACGVPCVVTDVGDSAWIVGDRGIVVPPSDPEALKNGMIQLIELRGTETYSKEQIRQLIVQQFSVEQLSQKTKAVFLSEF